jgi:arylformamidase
VINLKKILLSYHIDNNSPYYIGTAKPNITANTQIDDGDDYNSYLIEVFNHGGTHVDAPRHFISGAREISEYDIEELSFTNPLIIDCKKEPNTLITVEDIEETDLKGFDCILFRTGFEKYRKEDLDMYLTQYPGVSPDTIHWIRKNHQNIRCIGINCISMARYDDAEIAKKTHITAFKIDESYGEPLLFIEDMRLEEIGADQTISCLIIVPWQIKGIDSAPCTIIGSIDFSFEPSTI